MELSYEKAFEHKPEPEDVELYKINMDEFQTNIKLFLEGLGPTGYALLKVSYLRFAVSCNYVAFIQQLNPLWFFFDSLLHLPHKPSGLMLVNELKS